MSDPRPFDVDAFARWLRRQPGLDGAGVRDVVRLTEGMSNVTCRVDLDGAPVDAAVLRVQPASGIFEPYDVLREATVLRCLAPSEVPVPTVLATEADPGVLGQPFFLMEWIDAPHLGVPEAEGGPAAVPFEGYMATLVDVHHVDVAATGLDVLGVPESPEAGFDQEVALVGRRMAAQGIDDPLLVDAHERLRAVRPTGGRLGLCQGDVNVFNYLTRDGAIVGVVDWEQARISDPRSDLGQLLALMVLKGVPFGPADDEGFVAMYRAAGGEVAPGMEAFRALWFFQLGVIHRAFTAGTGDEPWYAWAQIEEALPRSLARLEA